jgi:DNA-binding NtrC family response regulator
MSQNESTLRPSGRLDRPGRGGAVVSGLLRVFGGGAAMAQALPIEGEGLELGRRLAALGDRPDLRISRRHARAYVDGHGIWVEDLGSQNGSFGDGEPLAAGKPREVRRVLRLGDSLFVPFYDLSPLARQGVEVHDGFVRGPAMAQRLVEAGRAAELGLSLHIRGQSGTGKEGVARAFHERGPRRAGPFVAVNCAAIPSGIAERLLFGARRGAYSGADTDVPGYLQAAEGGTLFLDEVAELDLDVQAKLLRVLESREVLALGAAKPKKLDFAFCSASHRDLRAQVAAGRLREDLYFRLGRPEIALPLLRQRPEELPFLLEREIANVAPSLGLHVSLVEACLLRPWPGNVRELLVEARSAAQAALMQAASRVEAEHLGPSAGTLFESAPVGETLSVTGLTTSAAPSAASAARASAVPRAKVAPRIAPLDAEERSRIEVALRGQDGNVRATARALGMHRTRLRRLIERHGLAPLSDGDDEA